MRRNEVATVATSIFQRKAKARPVMSSNFVDTLLTQASNAKKSRLEEQEDVPVAMTNNSYTPFTACNALSALVFGNGNAENGSLEGDSPPLSGASSAALDFDLAGVMSAVNGAGSEGMSSPPPPVDGVEGSTYFSCGLCNKYFWTETSLKHHSSLFHSEKSFVCEICGKAFRFRSNLAEHRSVHTSLKPYVCKFCGKSSRLKGNLTKHILKHHKKEQDAYIGKDDIIIKKGKKSIKDPIAVDFLERSMIVLTSTGSPTPIMTTLSMQNAGRAAAAATAAATSDASGNNGLGSAALQLLSMASKTSSKQPSSSKQSSSSVSSKKPPRNDTHQSPRAPGSSPKNGKIFDDQPAGDFQLFNSFSGSVGGLLKGQLFGAEVDYAKSEANDEEDEEDCEAEDLAQNDPFLAQGQTADQLLNATDFFENFCMQFNSGSSNNMSAQKALEEFINTSANMQPKSGLSNASSAKGSTGNSNSSNGGGTRCQLCGKHFRKATNLAVHMSIKHHGVSPVQPPSSGQASPLVDVMPKPIIPQSTMIQSALAPSVISKSIIVTQPPNPYNSHATPILLNPTTIVSAPPPLKIGNRMAVMQSTCGIGTGGIGTGGISTGGISTMKNYPAFQQSSSPGANVGAPAGSSGGTPPQMDVLNGLMTKSGVSKDLKEIRSVLNELKRGLPDVTKLDELLSAMDARVDRLERQLETSVNTLYILVQMQSDMNTAFAQFKNDIVERLKTLMRQHNHQVNGVDDEEEEEGDEEEEEEDEMQMSAKE